MQWAIEGCVREGIESEVWEALSGIKVYDLPWCAECWWLHGRRFQSEKAYVSWEVFCIQRCCDEVMIVLAKYYLSVDAWRAVLVMIIHSHFHSGTMFGVELWSGLERHRGRGSFNLRVRLSWLLDRGVYPGVVCCAYVSADSNVGRFWAFQKVKTTILFLCLLSSRLQPERQYAGLSFFQ